MIVSILITIIAFVAAIFIMKKQIDEESKKQEENNAKLINKVKDDLGKSVQTQDNLNKIAKTVANSLSPQISEGLKQKVDNTSFEEIKELHQNVIRSNIENISDVKSNISLIETGVQTNLDKFREVDRELSEVSNSVTNLGTSIDELNNKLSENTVSNSNIINDLNSTITDIINSNNQLVGSNNSYGSNDLIELNNKIENISEIMSNLDLESINSNISLLDEQFKTLPNLSEFSSNNYQNNEDNKQALNRFFDITSSDFVTQYKSAESGMGFKQWFDSSYKIGLNTNNFDNFESLIQKSDSLYTKVFETQDKNIIDIENDITSIRQSLGSIEIGVNDDGNIINLGQIEDILRSNATHIDQLRNTLNKAVADELTKIDGGVLAKKFIGKNIKLKDLESSGRITAKDVSAKNLDIDGNLNVAGKNIQDKLQDIEIALANISNNGGNSGDENGINTNLIYTTDTELASKLGVKNADFIQQRSFNLLGSNVTNIPQKYIHSVSGNDEGAMLFHEIDFANQTSNVLTINPGVGNISGSTLANKISGDEEATFTNGIRLGNNGCLKLNEESSGKPRLDLCDKNCTTGCRKVWDYHYAPEPK